MSKGCPHSLIITFFTSIMSSDTSESFDSSPSEAPSSESSGYHLSSPSLDVDRNQQTTSIVTRARARVFRTTRTSSATAAIYATNPPLNPLPIHTRQSDPATSASSSGRGVNPPSHASTHSSNSVNRSPTPLATTARSSVAPSVAASSATASSGGSSGASNMPFRRRPFHHTNRRIGSPRARGALRQAGRVVGPRPTNLPIVSFATRTATSAQNEYSQNYIGSRSCPFATTSSRGYTTPTTATSARGCTTPTIATSSCG